MKRSWRFLAASSMIAAAFCFVGGLFVMTLSAGNAADRDFIEYWAAEQTLIHTANPYDPAATLRIEQSAGFEKSRAEFWYCPPVDLFLAWPLGFVSAKTGLILWTFGMFASLSASLWTIWVLHGAPDTLLPLLGFLFAPALICLQAGQISLLLLLAVVIFFRFQKSQPFLAGVALLPCTLKPHLFLPFAIALFLWAVHEKSYRVVAGFVTAFAVGCTFAFYFDAHAWSQYSHLMKADGMLNEWVPTLSETFRYAIHRQWAWLQFVPDAVGCCWAVWYFWTRRERWNWMDQGLVLLLVSAICRAYGWIFDESVLLPAMLTAGLRARQSGRSLWPIGLFAGIALMEALSNVKVASPYYLWTTPAWLGCYLYATRSRKTPAPATGTTKGQVGSSTDANAAVSSFRAKWISTTE